jgi:cobalt-zinc-cadmium resistance protein CzcA
MYTRILMLLLLLPFGANAQSLPLTMDKAVDMALQQNKGLQSANTQVDYYRYLSKTAGEVAKTEVSLQYGQYNSYVKNDNHFAVSQALPFPTVFGARKQLNSAQIKKAEWFKANTQNELVYQVKQVYVQLLNLKEQKRLLLHQDSLFATFARSADLRYRTGESRMLEKVAAEARLNEVKNKLQQQEADANIYMARLQALLGINEIPDLTEAGIPESATAITADTSVIRNNPYLEYLRQDISIAEKQKQLLNHSILPDITLGYFNLSLIGTPVDASGTKMATGSNRFQGFQVGVALPLWMGPMKAKVRAEEKQRQVASLSYDNSRTLMKGEYQQAVQQYIKQQQNLAYYKATALPNAELILLQSQLAYTKGEISYAEHFINMEQALGIRQGYLQTLHDAKQASIYIEFLQGNL